MEPSFPQPPINATEQIFESVFSQFHQIFIRDRLDDTEHIRNIKTVLSGIDEHCKAQEKVAISIECQSLKQRLYRFSKSLWMEKIRADRQEDRKKEGAHEEEDSEEEDYFDYYFDYIYNHGVYPR